MGMLWGCWYADLFPDTCNLPKWRGFKPLMTAVICIKCVGRYAERTRRIPSGNQTWQWKMDNLETSICRFFPIAMFDYWRVSLIKSVPLCI